MPILVSKIECVTYNSILFRIW